LIDVSAPPAGILKKSTVLGCRPTSKDALVGDFKVYKDNTLKIPTSSRQPLFSRKPSSLQGKFVSFSLDAGSSATQSKRRNKTLNARQSRPSYILGKDVALNRMLSLSTKALVGIFFYVKMSKDRLKAWISKEWKQFLGYCPRFCMLSNFWIVFHFLSEEDLWKVEKKVWLIDIGVLMLKKWSPDFNPFTEFFQKRRLWVLFLPRSHA